MERTLLQCVGGDGRGVCVKVLSAVLASDIVKWMFACDFDAGGPSIYTKARYFNRIFGDS